MSEEDQEITLGTGRLLGLFFGLVVVCALFLCAGFWLGRRSTSDHLSAFIIPAAASSNGAVKPSPVRSGGPKPDCATPGACPDSASKSSSDELTFYKAVEQNEPKAKLDPAVAQPSPVAAKAPDAGATTPEMPKPLTLGVGYIVQVAAVTKQEDADALVSALRKKDYPVITTSAAADKLYHVQVGPFADLNEAESTRAKLISDGYNPILKK